MEKQIIESLMISANASTIRNIMDVHESGIIAYGASNTILISDSEQVFMTLNQHTSRVNQVQWL